MKPILASIVTVFFSISVFSQNSDKGKKSDECPIKDPLPSEAFNKMITQDITYAITGENTPVSGIKIDISKPEATISGVFMPKKNSKVPWDLFGFDFKGGITDKNFSILKGFNSFNTAFEFKPSFHFIPAWNSAKYGICEVATPKTLIVNAKNHLVERYAASITDTFYIMAVIKNRHLGAIGKLEDVNSIIPGATLGKITKDQEKILVFFVKRILKAETINEKQDAEDILKLIPVAAIKSDEIDAETYYDDVIELFKKYQKLFKNLDDDKLNKKIANTSEIWTKKTYMWFTVSPFARTEKVNEFYVKFEDKDSLYFKSDYRFYYGVSGLFNHYVVYPNKIALLFRVGLSMSRNSNFSSLTSFNYESKTSFFSSGNTVTQKTKSGTAYNHDDIKQDLAAQLNFEYYLLPLKSLIPGLYFSPNLNFSKLYELPNVVDRGDDKIQIGLEGGLVFNINSREKDKEKNILSIIAYMRHEDLTDSRRTALQTGIEEPRDDFRKRNLSIGFRVGIPITLPQRQN